MVRPKLDANQKKDKRLTVRFRFGEMVDLASQADLCGLGLSELVRRRALHRRIVSKADLKTISELRRLGGLLKQLFTETNGLYGNKTGPLLDEIRGAIVRIGREEDA